MDFDFLRFFLQTADVFGVLIWMQLIANMVLLSTSIFQMDLVSLVL